MQRLYVVACAVDLTEPSAETTAFDQLVEHLALHLEGARTGLGSADLLDGPGTAVVTTRRSGWADNHLAWRPVLVDDRSRALRLTIEHELHTGGRFVCELTAAEHAGETGFRVVLGRRSDGRVTPARVDDLKPPRALRAVMADDLLRCTDGTDRITATVTHALTAGVADLRDRLADPQRRLPILAVSAMRPTGAPAVFARAAADQLAGLAHVVVISGWLALSAFNADRGEQHRLYRDSARLFWPDLGAWNPWWDAAALHGSHDDVLARITRTITPFSVVARGRDRLWDAVRTADNDSALDGIAETEAARITALEAKLAEEQELNLELLEANEQLEQQIRSLQIELENRHVQRAYAPPAPAEPEAEAASPTRDFTGQWAVWEARSEGALVFTDRAKSSWADCVYDDYESMWEALDALADLAQAWRSADGHIGKRLEDWIRERTALKYAHSDEGLRRAGLHTFTFDGRPMDRTPHIKLDDHKKPNQVGRVYFAIDNVDHRWIVDHVGLKLYRI